MLAPIGLSLCLVHAAGPAKPEPPASASATVQTGTAPPPTDAAAATEPVPAAATPPVAAEATPPGTPAAPATVDAAVTTVGTTTTDTVESSGAPTAQEPPAATGPGALIIGPGVSGRLTVHLGELVIAQIDARAADEAMLRLPPGRYRLTDAAGRELTQLDVSSNQTTQYAPAGAVVAQVRAGAESSQLEDASTAEPSPGRESAHRGGQRWRTIASPLMAATLPGLGHMVNGHAGKGVAIMLSTFGMGIGAAALFAAGTNEGRAFTGADKPSFGVDAVRLGAVGALTGALQLLYAGQIMDAHAITRRGPVAPRRSYKIAFELTRMATVGMNARDQEASLYSDWGLSMMGQPLDRLTVGVSDVSLKTNWDATRSTMQAGARVGYRFYEHERLWLGGAVGTLIQGSFRDIEPGDYDPNGEWTSEKALTAAPYLQFETRWFMLDRWSLHVMPRVSMPFGSRYYSGARSIPNQALTFEIGSGIGVQF